MPKIIFTENLRRHLECPEGDFAGATVREVLETVFAETPKLRSYILDDNGAVRTHVNIFVDGRMIEDRWRQQDAVQAETEIYVMQSISGG